MLRVFARRSERTVGQDRRRGDGNGNGTESLFNKPLVEFTRLPVSTIRDNYSRRELERKRANTGYPRAEFPALMHHDR